MIDTEILYFLLYLQHSMLQLYNILYIYVYIQGNIHIIYMFTNIELFINTLPTDFDLTTSIFVYRT